MQGDSTASRGQAGLNATRAEPKVFPHLDEVADQNSGSHATNVSAWCYTEQDIQDILSEAVRAADSTAGDGGGTLPLGVLWTIGVGMGLPPHAMHLSRFTLLCSCTSGVLRKARKGFVSKCLNPMRYLFRCHNCRAAFWHLLLVLYK